MVSLSCMLLAACTGNRTEPESTAGEDLPSVTWAIDNLESIGGYPVTVVGDPKVIGTPKGRAVEFDGIDDGLFIDTHPLEGAETVTLEVVFRPDSGGPPEQRFFHLQVDGVDDRFLVETRIDGDQWWLDTYMASGKTDQTLIDPSKKHPVDQWYTAVLVFDGSEVRHYVNGKLEFSAPISYYTPPGPGKTSVGVRINKVYWFKGAVREARFTRGVRQPGQFLEP